MNICAAYEGKLRGRCNIVHQTAMLYAPLFMKESSNTTKLRVVFNAWSKSSSILLNEALLRGGPILQLVFYCYDRSFKYALTADIAKMYHQILIKSNQTLLQRRQNCGDGSLQIASVYK